MSGQRVAIVLGTVHSAAGAVRRGWTRLRGLAHRAAWHSPAMAVLALPQLLALRRRGLFDADFYREAYPDLGVMRRLPFVHWAIWGAREGRSPGAAFDAAWYLGRYPDVARSGMPPLVHYIRHGVREGRVAGWLGTDARGAAPVVRPRRTPGAPPLALVVDSRWPQPDRDAGSVETRRLVDALRGRGYRVVFAAGSEEPADAPYRVALEERGVRCLPPLAARPLAAFLEAEGFDLDLCVLYRVSCGGTQFETVRAAAGGARVVFNTVDLHFVREEREARLRGDRRALTLAAATRERELYLVRNADATVVVSGEERALLERLVPGARVAVLPLSREVHAPVAGYGSRSGIGFVGGFAHAPNVDAVGFFVTEVWPRVRRARPDCEFAIVGPGLPDELLRRLPQGARYLGHVPDLTAWLEGIRVAVAPLRYGAGAKGKVVSALAHGVPCVTTSVGAEGLALEHGSTVLVADAPEDFAARVLEAYDDRALWERLSARGLDHARRAWSVEAWDGRLTELLASIGAPRPGGGGETTA